MKKEEGQGERERERVAKRCVQLLVGWQATRFKETIKNVLHCIVQEDLDTLAEATADVYRQAWTSAGVYLQTPRDRAIHALVFFSPFLAKEEEEEERKKKKRRKKIKLCSPDAKFAVLRSLINAVKQAQVTNWRVICIVIVTQAFARRNGEGAAGTKGWLRFDGSHRKLGKGNGLRRRHTATHFEPTSFVPRLRSAID